jgi:hypothetical protein
MGNLCCTPNGLDVEDLISEIFSKTYLVNFEFYEVENKLKDYSFNNKISKDDFDILVLSKFYSKDIKYSTYLDRIMEYIIIKDKESNINIYMILLAIYSFINNRKDVHNLYYIFENVNCRPFQKVKTHDLQLDEFKHLFELYISFVICRVSQGVVTEMSDKKENDTEITEHMKSFTEENCNKYTQSLLQKYESNTINLARFEKFISDKPFLYSYKELRENFLDYVRFN